ncbi:MAG: site-specific integrase, partial [Bacteroidales bacterium]|nr:site-specific integrase [Bacteroidales bacterium]
MKSTFRVLFFLKRDKQKKDGRTPLMCRITVDGKESRFNMKMDILPEHWDVKASKAMGRAKEVDEINSLIDNVKASLYQIYR